jgi:hypothetical protein
MPMPGNDPSLPPLRKQTPPPHHRGGDCDCTRKVQRIVRYYYGYGYCGTCGKLTREKKK